MTKFNSQCIYLDNASASLKLPSSIEKLLASYTESDWIQKKDSYLSSFLLKLSRLLSLNVSQISLVPSASYGINKVWEDLIVRGGAERVRILISEAEHISNLASLIQLKERIKDKKKISIEYYTPENIERRGGGAQIVVLLTIRDNLGLQSWTIEQVQELKRKQPHWQFIGDFTQAIADLVLSKRLKEHIKFFDYLYFSAHKFYGPFGLGVVVKQSQKGWIKQESERLTKESRARLDWRSIYIWAEELDRVVNALKGGEEKKQKLLTYWRENFPVTTLFEYMYSQHSLIFLVSLNFREGDILSFHDLISLFDLRGIIFRANELCSSNPLLKDGSFMRFSLSVLNEEAELEKLFKCMREFEALSRPKSIKI